MWRFRRRRDKHHQTSNIKHHNIKFQIKLSVDKHAVLAPHVVIPLLFYTTLLPTGPQPNNVSLAETNDSSIVVISSVPPQLQFANFGAVDNAVEAHCYVG